MIRGYLIGCLALSVSLFWEPAEVQAQAPKEFSNSLGMKLVRINKGSFTMGSPEAEIGRAPDELEHPVTLRKDYYLGVCEVTQSQYQKVMRKNPSYFQGRRVDGESGDLPVEQVSWEDAVLFCKRLSELPEEKMAGRSYRLPTEAEWEFACRADSSSAYFFDTDPATLDEYAWFKKNSADRTHPVGTKKPNPWGLFDMHGNVAEWCSDWFAEYPTGEVFDPIGPKKETLRISRGGGWNFEAPKCRSASRDKDQPISRYVNLGFRVALDGATTPSPNQGSSQP